MLVLTGSSHQLLKRIQKLLHVMFTQLNQIVTDRT